MGDIALVKGYVYGTGQTGVRVRTRVYRDREPTPIPDLTVSTERGEALQAGALTDEPGQ